MGITCFVTDATDPDFEMLYNFVEGIEIKLCNAMFQEIVFTACLIQYFLHNLIKWIRMSMFG
jgi:hypothetical protein